MSLTSTQIAEVAPWQRLAYLLFHWGLKPREIVHVCSPEWSSVPEISALRRTIMERVLHLVDALRWRLS